jgi:hypothetical protein
MMALMVMTVARRWDQVLQLGKEERKKRLKAKVYA